MIVEYEAPTGPPGVTGLTTVGDVDLENLVEYVQAHQKLQTAAVIGGLAYVAAKLIGLKEAHWAALAAGGYTYYKPNWWVR